MEAAEGVADTASPEVMLAAASDCALPKLRHKNDVFDQILGCSGHFDVASEKWAPVALNTVK